MVKIDDPKFSGAELIRELKKTGTSDSKLEYASQVLGFIFRKEKRVASAAEIIDAMEKQGVMTGFMAWSPTPALTLQKAYALARTGKWEGPVETKEVSIEDMILAGQELPEEPVKSAAEEVASQPAPAIADTKADTLVGLKPMPKGFKKPGVSAVPATV